jgi:hypothetical protein
MGVVTGRLVDCWRRTPLSRHPRLTGYQTVPTRTDVPDPLPRRRIVLVGTPPKWAVFACPCGTGHTIELNLAHPARSRWKLADRGRPTICPSIDVRRTLRACHFWVRHGRVTWAK